MSAQSYTLREGSTYREALLQMGNAHQSIGAAQSELVRTFHNRFHLFDMTQLQLFQIVWLELRLGSATNCRAPRLD